MHSPATIGYTTCRFNPEQTDFSSASSVVRPDGFRSEFTVKYLCLVYGEEKQLEGVADSECLGWGETLRKNGRYIAAEALQPVRTARTVRVRNGKTVITDGPFTEAKEHVAGFYLIDAADLNEAVQIASQIPPARVGSIEVRPIRELGIRN
jgi:hypothetical protein